MHNALRGAIAKCNDEVELLSFCDGVASGYFRVGETHPSGIKPQHLGFEYELFAIIAA